MNCHNNRQQPRRHMLKQPFTMLFQRYIPAAAPKEVAWPRVYKTFFISPAHKY